MIDCPSCRTLHAAAEDICPHCKFSPTSIKGFKSWAPDMAFLGGGFKPEYFHDLVEQEGESFWFRARNELIAWMVARYFPAVSSFLEVGCGTGFVLQQIGRSFPGAQLTGSEIFVEGLQFAAARVEGARFLQMDARRIPYVDEFDVIGAFDVLEHIEEDELVLRNIWRATKSGGGVLVSVPQHQWLWSAADDHACHVRRYRPHELETKMRDAGFTVVRSTSFVSLLLPAMAFSRWRARGNAENFDPNEEFSLAPGLNSILEHVMRAERGAIRLGLDFPAGGSRLVIARKENQ